MDTKAITDKLLALLSREDYTPMRKRGLKRALGITEEDYRAFRELLKDLAGRGTISDARGRYSLPMSGDATRRQAILPGL